MRIIKILKPYLILVVLFIILGYFFKTIETFSFFKTQDTVSFLTIFRSYFNITVVFCLFSLIILPFYLLVALLNQKVAQILTSILFAVLISLEIGLYIYYQQAGVLMGRELVIRPLTETLITIRNSSNIFLNSVLIAIVLAYFIALPFVFKKVRIFNDYRSSTMAIIIIGILSTCTLFYQRNENQIVNNFLESKSFFFFSALKNYSIDKTELDFLIFDEAGSFGRIQKNEEILKEYIALYNKTAEDLDYPMERSSTEIPNVLSPYFKSSEKQPNIVIIMVESLGNYLMGEKGENISFMPYLDSLANSGLYWKNCLSTTSRTYGVIPSVTGSVPHGIKGFQFGIMPRHHSLFSILKNNDYITNFFYGGDTNFDNMLDFLVIQNIDRIDNFMPQMKTFRKEKQANWWGIHDQVLFDKSLEYLKTLPSEKPKLNVYLTVTTHDPFNNREDKKLKEYYTPKVEKIFSKLNKEQRNYFLPIKDKIAGFMYLDDCVRNFINDYSKRQDFENTIFIITGDHSVGIYKNYLSYYSVPLIIWSPLLKTSKKFPNIVSHLAITPSIVSLLQNNYNVNVPDKLSWCSAGLDTASVFNPSEKFLFLNYNRVVDAMVYNEYLFEDQRLYKINEDLDLEYIHDPKLVEQIYSKFKTLKYVNNYVYHNNRLIKAGNNSDSGYRVIKVFENKNTLICKTPDTIPSISGIDIFDILPAQRIKGKYNKIKIKLKANIVINDPLLQDQHMMLNFVCTGKNYRYASKEHIVKYIADDNIICNKEYVLSIEKEIDVRNLKNFSVHIYVSTNEWDENWKRDKKITLSNMNVVILGK